MLWLLSFHMAIHSAVMSISLWNLYCLIDLKQLHYCVVKRYWNQLTYTTECWYSRCKNSFTFYYAICVIFHYGGRDVVHTVYVLCPSFCPATYNLPFSTHRHTQSRYKNTKNIKQKVFSVECTTHYALGFILFPFYTWQHTHYKC